MSEVKIKIKDKEYTIEEAKELYLELSQLFKEKEYLPYIPYPYPHPTNPPIPIMPWYDTGPTCSGDAPNTI